MSVTQASADKIYDVAIVGYGPVGATLANLLGQEGLSVQVLEREAAAHHQPRAGHMDGEVVRVFQSIGLADAILEHAYVNPGMQFQNAAGEVILDWPRPQEPGPEGWHPSYRFHQPWLESCLRAGVARLPQVEVQLRQEVVSVRDDGRCAEIEATSLDDGRTRRFRARYAVGCDGARSLVRRSMGVKLEDLKSHQQWLILDLKFTGKEDTLPVKTIQYCDPERPVTMAKMVGNRRRWEIMLMEGETPEAITRPENYWRLLERWVSPDDVFVERAVVYTFHSVVADAWRLGPLILAGDSCHQTPPFMGQGMCAGIRDAANLSWKLAAVIRGAAPDTLLDTYVTERAPHVRTFIETAIRLGSLVHVTDPEEARQRDARLREAPGVMTTPAPPLGPGLSVGDTPAAGTRSRQIKLSDGRLSDELVGRRFGLFVRDGLAPNPSADLAVLTCANEPAIAAWLDELGTNAVLVRPDRYILGVAADAASLAGLLDHRVLRNAA
jgi:3-(3-hydroxy-phenyl)propionate hydroxylase